jgi:hypothetical protein
MAAEEIFSEFPFHIHYIMVDQNFQITYVDTYPEHELQGTPVVFMHGNPAYSYL